MSPLLFAATSRRAEFVCCVALEGGSAVWYALAKRRRIQDINYSNKRASGKEKVRAQRTVFMARMTGFEIARRK